MDFFAGSFCCDESACFCFPDPPEDQIESVELKYRADPINEEHDGQVGDDEIVSQDDAQVQVMWHKSSFFRGGNLWKNFLELNKIVIYLEGANLNEIREDCQLSLEIFLGKR